MKITSVLIPVAQASFGEDSLSQQLWGSPRGSLFTIGGLQQLLGPHQGCVWSLDPFHAEDEFASSLVPGVP